MAKPTSLLPVDDNVMTFEHTEWRIIQKSAMGSPIKKLRAKLFLSEGTVRIHYQRFGEIKPYEIERN